MRTIRPPSALPVAPLIISQVNCEAGAGLKPWKFLELVATLNIPHRREGKLVLVEASVLVAALRAEHEQSVAPITPEAEADRILALVGRRRAS